MTNAVLPAELDAIPRQLSEAGLDPWGACAASQLGRFFLEAPHGDWPAWQKALQAMPSVGRGRVLCRDGALSVDPRLPLADDERGRLSAALAALHPWRKGPYDLAGVMIDTEWRSDWKWDRLAPALRPLEGRVVLDVGCGNGYHCWRAALDGARLAVGIDPTAVYVAQYLAVRRLAVDAADEMARRVIMMPIGIEALPPSLRSFETVLSMGVLYHRRSPVDHLLELRACLRPGGQLVLETLILDKADDRVLVPPGRYAKMRNVWFIPTTALLGTWLRRAGFRDVELVDVTATTFDEQRSTPWMRFESLENFLDPADPSLTLEGHPAPVRAIMTATA